MSTALSRMSACRGGGRARVATGRAEVGEIQRARLIGALTELVAERRAGGVSVARIVARSGVSRRTFYEHFTDRESCFLEAFERGIARAAENVIPAYRMGGRWRERIRASLAGFLEFVDTEPQTAYLCVVGALGSGDRALERRARVVETLVEAVHEGRFEVRAGRRTDRLLAEGLVGAVLAVIHTRLQEPETGKPFTDLLNPMMSMIVMPYLGAAAAARELQHPAPETPARKPPTVDPLRELDMRLTYRTIRVMLAIASNPAASNREVGYAAGIADQGQISKLLARLQGLGLIQNNGGDHSKGEPNAWTFTAVGQNLAHTLSVRPVVARVPSRAAR
jgi:AcrR family transcriptional regulator